MRNCYWHFKTSSQSASPVNSGISSGNLFIIQKGVLKTEAGAPGTRAECAQAPKAPGKTDSIVSYKGMREELRQREENRDWGIAAAYVGSHQGIQVGLQGRRSSKVADSAGRTSRKIHIINGFI